MKKKNFSPLKCHYILIVLVTAILGCEPLVYFDQPQPSDVAKISRLPDTLIGTYYSPKERNLIYVDSEVVYIIDLYDYVDEIKKLGLKK